MSENGDHDNMATSDVENMMKRILRSTSARTKRAPLEVFSGHPSQDVTVWIEDYKDRAKANGWDEETGYANIIDYLSGAAKNWYHITVRDATVGELEELNTVEKVLESLKTYFTPEENDEYLRAEIENMKQGGEPVVNYLSNKRALCRKLSKQMEESELVRQLIKGMKEELALKVFESRPKDFKSLLDVARKVETNMNMFKNATVTKTAEPAKNEQKETIETLKDLVTTQVMASLASTMIQNNQKETKQPDPSMVDMMKNMVLETMNEPQNMRNYQPQRGNVIWRNQNQRVGFGGQMRNQFNGYRSDRQNRGYNNGSNRNNDYRNDNRNGSNRYNEYRSDNRNGSNGNQNNNYRNNWVNGHPHQMNQNNNQSNQVATNNQVPLNENPNAPQQNDQNMNRGRYENGVQNRNGRNMANRYQDRNDTRTRNGGPRCYNCGRFGHVAVNCGFQQNSNRPQMTLQPTVQRTVMMADLDDGNPSSFTKLPISINGIHFDAIVDCAADSTIIGSNSEAIKGMEILPYDGPSVVTFQKKPIKIKGKVVLEIEFMVGGKLYKKSLPVIVVDYLDFVLLGNDFNASTDIWINPKTKSIKIFNEDPQLNLINTDYSVQEAPKEEQDGNREPTECYNVAFELKSRPHDSKPSFGTRDQMIPEWENPRKTPEADNNLSTSATFGSSKEMATYVQFYDPNHPENYKNASLLQHISPCLDDTESPLIYDCIERTQIIPFDEGELRIGKDLNAVQEAQLTDLCYEYREIFAFDGIDSLGRCDFYEHDIDTGDHKPFYCQPYPTSDKHLAEIKDHIDELMKKGIIRRSKSPWASPCHIVAKKDEERGRLVLDFRKLNAITKRDSYPLPSIDLCLSLLRNAKYFSTIDLLSGFHQLDMKQDAIEKTAFNTHFGHFEFLRMPFGLMNAPASFQRVMDITLDGLKFTSCLVFIDDILVFSEDFDSHIQRLQQVFERLKLSGLKIKPKKISLVLPGVSFLGYFVDSEGIKMQPSKIEAITRYERPKSVSDVREFVGMANFYRKLFDHFSEQLEPLTRLTKKNFPFVWTEEQEKCFTETKRRILSFPILIHYDPSLPIEVHCDASGIGIGASIGHIVDGIFHAVQHASRLLSDCEKRYSTTDKEGLCIVWAVEKFKRYLMGLPFTVYTDHRALSWLQSKEKLPPRLQRYALQLQGHDMTIKYRAGKRNQDADALSRHPVSNPEETEENLMLFAMAMMNDIPDPFSKEVIEEQEKDPYFGPICRALKFDDETRKGVANYALVDGVLFKVKHRKTGEKMTLCVPRSLREDILYSIHDDVFGCHMGVVKTIDKLRERFYFRNMEQFVRNYIKSCKSCLTRKKPREKPTGFLKPIEVGKPFDMVGIDLWGPIKKSASGNKMVIVCTDYLTRYVEMKAVPDGSAWQVALFLVENVIKNHGCPSKLLTDRGRVFMADIMKDLYEILGIDKIYTTKYRPQTDGLTEAFNKTLGDMVSHYVSLDQQDWDRHLPLLQFSYNTTKNASTNYTPFFLVHGREARLPVDVQFEIPSLDTEGNITYYPYMLKDKLAAARVIAKENITKSQERSSKYYNEKRKPSDFKLNDDVLVYNPRSYKGKTNKILHRFTGPFRIIEVRPNNTVKIKSLSGRKLKKEEEIVNVDFLKDFNQRILYTSESETEQDDFTLFDNAMAQLQEETEIQQESDHESDHNDEIALRDQSVPEPESIEKQFKEATVQSKDEESSFFSSETTPKLENAPSISSKRILDAKPLFRRYDLRSKAKSHEQQPPFTSTETKTKDETDLRSGKEESHKYQDEEESKDSFVTARDDSTESSSDETLAQGPSLPEATRRKYIKKIYPKDNLRKSTRIKAKEDEKKDEKKKKPKRNFIFMVSFLLSFMDSSKASFTRVNPVIWRETARPVIAGVTQFYTNVFFASPCIIFNKTLTQKFEPYTESLATWCNEEFEESWIKPIESFCSNPYTNGFNELTRQKRFGFVSTVIASTIVITIFSQVGFFIYSTYDKASTKSEVASVAISQEKLIENMEKLKSNEQKVAQIMWKLESSQEELGKDVNSLSHKLNILMLNKVPILTNVAKLTAKLTVLKDRLLDIGREWSEGVFNPKIMEIFDLNLNCTDRCPLKLFKPQKCIFDRNKNKIVFSFQTRTVKSTATVLKADSFRLVQRKENSSMVCRKVFTGPKAVIYDKLLDCVTPLMTDTANNDDLILSPAVEYCSESSPLNNSFNLWKTEDCKEKEYLSEREFIQVKNSNEYNYVYCPTLKISVFNRTFDCPPHVFSLPYFTSFKIGKLSYNAEQLNMKSNLNVNPVSSSRVNFHLLPILPDLDFDHEEENRKLINSFDSDMKLQQINTFRSIDWIFVITISIIILVVFYKICSKLFLRHRINQLRTDHDDPEYSECDSQLISDETTLNPIVKATDANGKNHKRSKSIPIPGTSETKPLEISTWNTDSQS